MKTTKATPPMGTEPEPAPVSAPQTVASPFTMVGAPAESCADGVCDIPDA